MRLLFLAVLASSSAVFANAQSNLSPSSSDIVIYGCTAAGITAAVEARRQSKTVSLICRDAHIGGMTTNGLGWADTGNHGAIGGLAKQFYRDVQSYYAARGITPLKGQTKAGVDDMQAMYVFEPHVAETILEGWLRNAGVAPVRSAPLLRDGRGVVKRGSRIVSLTVKDGRVFRGRTFIDASYEGDLMAEAGVSFATGREDNEKYGETHNGSQATQAIKHQFELAIDPYRVAGVSSSGLLPGIDATPAGADGRGDFRVQAYTYRLCMTQKASIRAPFPKPTNYDPQRYELLARYLDAGWRDLFAKYDPIPNQKTDTNNHGAFSMDDIGANYTYPTGSDEERKRVADDHRSYQQGLLWFMQNDPRAPADVRAAMAPWGLCNDEFIDNGNWPRELYIREARRMVSDFVMTEPHLLGYLESPKPIGLGSYAMDSHNVRRFVDANGHVRNEGDIQIEPGRDYPIDYGAVVPKKAEADNLFVPIALSASHIAYGSVRMEPVFMILGQSSAAAAALAIDRNLAVQDVPYNQLRSMLIAQGQVLEGTESAHSRARRIAVMHKKKIGAGVALALGMPMAAAGAYVRRRRRQATC